MMRFILWLTVWLRRIVVLVILIAIGLAAPIGYVEFMCKGTPLTNDYASILPEANRRPESRTYTTYPEWHIVHAYEDYASVIQTQDPHTYEFFPAIKGYWSSLCELKKTAEAHGGMDTSSKQTLYTIGASFTLEMALKAAYEETLGRIMTLVRGPTRAPLDDLSALQASAYADFLNQTPWYKWNFTSDANALWDANSGVPRDWERAIALGIENRTKALYAGVIGKAVDNVTGPDELTLRSVVKDMAPEALQAIPGVTVVATLPQGIEIETPRYAAFTQILMRIAEAGGSMVEIAGNDDILVTVLTDSPATPGITPLYSFQRQGTRDYRHLVEMKVWGLTNRLRELEAAGVTVEHVHDY